MQVTTIDGKTKVAPSSVNIVEDLTPECGGPLATNSFAINESEGANVASATTCDIFGGNDGNTLHITGTTQIDDFTDASSVGQWRRIIFDGILTLTHGSGITCPGSASITTAVGDYAFVYAETVSAFTVLYFRADGTALVAPAASSSAEDAILHGFELTTVVSGTTVTIGAGKVVHGSTLIDKTADTTLTYGTAADWWDGAQDSYSGGAGWAYVGVDSSGNVKFLGANPPDKSDVSGNSAGELLYWYDATLYWRVVAAVYVNTSDQSTREQSGIGRGSSIVATTALASGTSTSYASISLSAIVPATAKYVTGYLITLDNAADWGSFLASTSSGLNQIRLYINASGSGTTDAEINDFVRIPLIEVQTVYYKMVGADETGTTLKISGWET
jgi:hypothetical protein